MEANFGGELIWRCIPGADFDMEVNFGGDFDMVVLYGGYFLV